MTIRRSAEVVGSNGDLLTELLLRLPIKSLAEFKSVSKHWLSIITDPDFIRRKNPTTNAVSALYLDCRSGGVDDGRYELFPLDPSEHLDFTGLPRGGTIQQSCNGLLLLRSSEEMKFMVYNPTTKQSKTLPPLPLLPPVRAGVKMQIPGANLAFDPSKSPFYKVVCVLDCGSSFQILIYSSETGHWRVSGSPFAIRLREPPKSWNGVYCNDAIHWVSGLDSSLCFDMDEERMRRKPIPPPEDYDQWHRYFGESCGHLYLVDCYLDRTTAHIYMYEMERDRSGWFLKFQLGQDGLARAGVPEHIYPMTVVYVARGGGGGGGGEEEDLFMLLYMSDDKVIRFNLTSQSQLELYDMDSESYVKPIAYPYIESLSLV